MTQSLRQRLPPVSIPPRDLSWFHAQALQLDEASSLAPELLPQLARQPLIGAGVPKAWGGLGGTTADAVEAIAEVAEVSLTAAFVLWGHRSFVEYLLQSPNQTLRERLLPELLSGQIGGATGFSNAIKYLGGIESLQIQAVVESDGRWRLDGKLPWVTNLRPDGYYVAAVVEREVNASPLVVALPGHLPGIHRYPDLALAGLRASNTAAIDITGAIIDSDLVLHPDANVFLPQIRPAFLALQCGLSMGLIKAAVDAAEVYADRGEGQLLERVKLQREKLAGARQSILSGLDDGRFQADAPTLFRWRIALIEQVREALNLELEATGGRAYLVDYNPHFIRRWRESAFVPLVTPSLTQLQAQLTAATQPGGATS